MLDQQLLIGTVFLAGLASFLSPCIFPIIPIYFGILSKGGKKVLNTFLFILGLSLTFVSLGFSFGFLGNILFSNTTRIIAGIIVIILGIHQLGVFKIGLLERTKLVEIKTSGKSTALLQLGLPDYFIPQATQQEALADLGLDTKGIEEKILNFIAKQGNL